MYIYVYPHQLIEDYGTPSVSVVFASLDAAKQDAESHMRGADDGCCYVYTNEIDGYLDYVEESQEYNVEFTTEEEWERRQTALRLPVLKQYFSDYGPSITSENEVAVYFYKLKTE